MKNTILKNCFVISIFLINLYPQNNSGTVVISQLSNHSYYYSDGFAMPPEEYLKQNDPKIQKMDSIYVAIDNSEYVLATKQKSATINNLDIRKRHMIKIKFKDKIIESFWFSFKKSKNNKLTLYYGSGYGIWMLE